MRIPRWALALACCLAASPVRADVVLDWNEVALDAIRADRTNPPRASRNLALAHTAIYDAVNGLLGGYEAYHVTAAAPPGAAPEAAAAAAAHRVLAAVYPAQLATFDAALATSLAAIPAGVAKDAGVAWGVEVADAILALRADDGSSATIDYYLPEGSSWWAPTPPAFAAALLPQWGYVTPWTLRSGKQFRVPAPPPPNSPQYLQSFREVKRLGGSDSAHRTADQSEIALFWNDGPGSATPPGHWQAIAQGLAAAQGLTLHENARLFALLSMIQADAAIVSWDNKYAHSNWRPVTGIQQADHDGNPDTATDAGWTSYIGTPPFPSYTSGHSTFSGSSARVLAHLLGGDSIAFEATSDLLPGVTRSFTSLTAAAEEAGQSRIYGGIHWQYDNQYGLSSGRALADQAFFNFLRPLQSVGTCAQDASTLCLGDGRFAVSATWRTHDAQGTGQAILVQGDSGAFWFFDDSNVEVTVKVLDACTGFGSYWVFASGLTDVEVVLQVVDTHTGRVRSYFSPGGKPFAPVQDTDAFDCQ